MTLPTINEAQLNAYPVITATLVWQTSEGMPGNTGIVDGAGNRFEVTQFSLKSDKNKSPILVRKIAPNGAVVGGWRINMPPPAKLDGISVTASGADLIIEGVAHDFNPNPDRLSWRVIASIPGVFVQPNHQAGEAGAFVPAPQSGGEQVDYERIRQITQQAVNNGVQAIVDALRGSSNAVSKEEVQAIVEAQWVGDGPFYKGFGPYKRLEETVGEQLDKRGIGKPPIVPPKTTPTTPNNGGTK